MKFAPFKMAQFSQNWPVAGAVNLHSSNPEPFSWDELSQLTRLDLNAALSKASLGYQSTQGSVAVRELLIDSLYSDIQSNQTCLISGAQEGIFMVANSLLQPEDEVLTFTPCFEPLVKVAQSLNAQVKPLELQNNNGCWSIPWDTFEHALSHKTKMVIINFPHNPTGCSIDRTELLKIIHLCQQHDCWLFADEVFRGLEHDGLPLPAVADLYDKGISMGVMSKSLALPGIRLGWLATQNSTLLQQWLNIKSYLSICQSSLDAELCQVLLPHSKKLWQRSVAIINNNKIKLKCLLSNHPLFETASPTGSATAFITLKTNKDAESFCYELLQKHRIYVMPDSAFLSQKAGFRITLGKKQVGPLYRTVFSQT